MGVVVPTGDRILDPAGVTICFKAYGQALMAVSPDMSAPDDVRSKIATGILDLAVRGVRDVDVLAAAGIGASALE